MTILKIRQLPILFFTVVELLVSKQTIGRFSNFFQKDFSRRKQPYRLDASQIGQYIGLSGYNYNLLISSSNSIYSSNFITSINYKLSKRGGFRYNNSNNNSN